MRPSAVAITSRLLPSGLGSETLLASRIRAHTLVAVGLRDTVTPPSTVFVAYNAIQGSKEIAVYTYSGHELPTSHAERQLADVATRLR
jgi:cephalosporin-C deacetylase